MFWSHVLVSGIEFVVMVFLTGIFIYFIYRMFVKANPDFDMEEEIRKNNIAVGVLMASILIAGSTILYRGLSGFEELIRLHVSAPGQMGLVWWKIAILGFLHIVVALFMSVFTISVTLRLFGKLVKTMKPGKELQKGNIAVGLLLSAVVIVSALFIGSGVSSVAKAMVPQLEVSNVEVMNDY